MSKDKSHPMKLKSLGALRPAKKTKARSPDMTGQLTIQRHTFLSIAEDFKNSGAKEAVCNIAGWANSDKNGQKYLSVELSPRFPPPQRKNADQDILDYLLDRSDD